MSSTTTEPPTQSSRGGLWLLLRVALWIVGLPGQVASRLLRPHNAPQRLGSVRSEAVTQDAEFREAISASRQANAWLSLEPGLWTQVYDEGVITWAYAGRTAMVVGGLHGPRPRAALERFMHDARAVGFRRVMVFPVGPEDEGAVRGAGCQLICSGSEAIVALRDFTLRGRRFADLRQMRNRARRRHRLEIIELRGQARREARDELLHDYADWRASRRQRHPMRLLVGSTGWQSPELFDDALPAASPGRRVFAARYAGTHASDRRDDRPSSDNYAAFATFVPADRGRTWGLDVMSRPQNAPAGTMELLLSEAMRTFAEEGADYVSLGANPMAVAEVDGPQDGPKWLTPFFDWLYRSRTGNSLFNFVNLHRFKVKFGGVDRPVSFAIWPRVSPLALYIGCGMWGLFGPSWAEPKSRDDLQLLPKEPSKAAD